MLLVAVTLKVFISRTKVWQKTITLSWKMAQLAGAAEYTDCISAEG